MLLCWSRAHGNILRLSASHHITSFPFSFASPFSWNLVRPAHLISPSNETCTSSACSRLLTATPRTFLSCSLSVPLPFLLASADHPIPLSSIPTCPWSHPMISRAFARYLCIVCCISMSLPFSKGSSLIFNELPFESLGRSSVPPRPSNPAAPTKDLTSLETWVVSSPPCSCFVHESSSAGVFT